MALFSFAVYVCKQSGTQIRPNIFCLFVCLFWFFTSKSTIFQLCGDWSSWVEPVLKRINVSWSRTKHNDVDDAQTCGPSVKHSATEPLCSLPTFCGSWSNLCKTLMVFLKDFLKDVDCYKKKSADDKKHETFTKNAKLGNFACFFCCLLILFKINFFKNLFQEYHQSIKQFGSRFGKNILSGLIWVQTVCKGYKQTSPIGKEVNLM